MKIRERIEEIRGQINRYDLERAIGEIMDLANEYGYEEVTNNIIDNDYVDEMVKTRLESGGWQGVACMLSDINSMNDEYYQIDGYGNLENLHQYDCEIILDELEECLKYDIEEEDDEEEEEEEEEEDEE